MNRCIICKSNDYKLKLDIDTFRIVKCKNCKLTYLQNPLPIKNDIKTYNQYFEQSMIHPYQEDSPNLAMRTLWNINEQRMHWINQAKPEGSLLDIGSGRGYFLHHASRFGYDVEGIEISPLAALFCRQTYDIRIHIKNIEQKIIKDRKYDIITMWHVLEHFTNPLHVLLNIKSLLNEEGILFIEVPNINSLKFLLSSKRKKFVSGNHPRHHRFFFSAQTLSMLMVKAGFSEPRIMINAYHLPHQNTVKYIFKQFLKLLQLDSFINVFTSLQ